MRPGPVPVGSARRHSLLLAASIAQVATVFCLRRLAPRRRRSIRAHAQAF
ncbi:hypothetical protein WQQ_08070 [Hydrocarboniphaga effusa AP103]|uniref:Uncharacterized protein n=1 Tax=Hydrocarboniphaga effusa AP103 TaxID=1172194 RepID=I8TAE1_9GAMM|nr:hypothetical protein WQQ_08070 [Hydrocarboniphaga effusa AP103]